MIDHAHYIFIDVTLDSRDFKNGNVYMALGSEIKLNTLYDNMELDQVIDGTIYVYVTPNKLGTYLKGLKIKNKLGDLV